MSGPTAGMRIHATFNLISGRFLGFAIRDGCTPDRKHAVDGAESLVTACPRANRAEAGPFGNHRKWLVTWKRRGTVGIGSTGKSVQNPDRSQMPTKFDLPLMTPNPLIITWCPGRDSNPHGLAASGF